MKKILKGAVAASAAGALLLGGAGTLAYWTDEGTVTGTDIESGHLLLTNDTCLGWTIDGGAPVTTATRIVPGDVLTQVCTYTVSAEGDHIAASFDVSAPSFSGASALTNELVANASYKIGAVPVASFPASVSNLDVITATVTVTFTGASATNASKDLTGALDDITVTATQSHS
ncbi:alternate-type signal peptide domain-containing protein [Nocardioides sp.]|uniref:alternate-type signal peptide domain-containing protein n=1 Tax=Nocardioides sp. TaxID=35761 RepID=UPI00356A2663